MEGKPHEGVSEAAKVQETFRLVTVSREKISTVELDRECEVLTRYLIGQPPNGYVIKKYREAHQSRNEPRLRATNEFDAFLVRLARLHPLASRAVDSYAGVFYKDAAIRRRAILLLAILENSSPFFTFFDVPNTQSLQGAAFSLVVAGLKFSLGLIPAVLLLFPIRAIFALRIRLQKQGG